MGTGIQPTEGSIKEGGGPCTVRVAGQGDVRPYRRRGVGGEGGRGGDHPCRVLKVGCCVAGVEMLQPEP